MDEFASKKARWMMAIPRKAANVRTKWKFIAGKIIYRFTVGNWFQMEERCLAHQLLATAPLLKGEFQS
jgi:hypothetical protein